MFAVTSILVETDQALSPDLLQRAQSGDANAFCAYCRPHEARLFRQAMALCGDHALAEDLAQDTLVEAWRCLRRYNGRCRFFTWLCAILLNRYRNVRREKRPVPLSRLAAVEHERAHGAIEQNRIMPHSKSNVTPCCAGASGNYLPNTARRYTCASSSMIRWRALPVP